MLLTAQTDAPRYDSLDELPGRRRATGQILAKMISVGNPKGSMYGISTYMNGWSLWQMFVYTVDPYVKKPYR